MQVHFLGLSLFNNFKYQNNEETQKLGWDMSYWVGPIVYILLLNLQIKMSIQELKDQFKDLKD